MGTTRTLAAACCFAVAALAVWSIGRRVETFSGSVKTPCDRPLPGAISSSTVLGTEAVSDERKRALDELDAAKRLGMLHDVCVDQQSLFDVDSDQRAVTTAASQTRGDHFRFMDRQYVSCDFDNAVVNGLQYASADGSVSTNALCQAVPRARFTVTKRTSFASEKQGISPHKMDCGENALVGVGFESDRAGNVRARYDCAADVVVDPATVKPYFTGWRSYAASVDGPDVLDGHVVKCPDGHAVTYLTGAACPAGKQRTLVYKCAEIDRETSAAMRGTFSDGPRAEAVQPHESDFADVTPPPRNTFDDLKDAMRPVTNAIGKVANGLHVGHVKTKWAFDHGSKEINKVRGLSIQKLTDGGNTVGNALSKVVRAMASMFETIDRTFEKVIKRISKMIIEAVDSVGEFGYKGSFNTLRFVGDKIFRPISNAIGSMINGVTNMMDRLASVVRGIGTDASELVITGFDEVGAGIRNGVCVAFDNVVFKPLEGIGKAVRAIKKWANKVKNFFG